MSDWKSLKPRCQRLCCDFIYLKPRGVFFISLSVTKYIQLWVWSHAEGWLRQLKVPMSYLSFWPIASSRIRSHPRVLLSWLRNCHFNIRKQQNSVHRFGQIWGEFQKVLAKPTIELQFLANFWHRWANFVELFCKILPSLGEFLASFCKFLEPLGKF